MIQKTLIFLFFSFAMLPKLTLAFSYQKQDFDKIIGSKDEVQSYSFLSCKNNYELFNIRQNTRLNPKCTYKDGFRIVKSNTTLDCRGATIQHTKSSKRSTGIIIDRDIDGRLLKNITIRNCRIQGFYININIKPYEISGIRAHAKNYSFDPDQMTFQADEQANEYKTIRIINNLIYDSEGAGLFLRPFTQDVLIKQNKIAGSGGVGIYLGAYSRFNKIVNNRIYANGYSGSLPPGGKVEEKFLGLKVIVYYTGREGIAVDASQANEISYNHIHGNAAGGIFLYKNTSEKPFKKNTWFERKIGSFENHIHHNLITSNNNSQQPVGIWIGARMSQNTATLYGSDEVYFSDKICMFRTFWGSCLHRRDKWLQQDSAKNNLIQSNIIKNFFTGIRVEDDYNRVFNNKFIYNSNKLFHPNYSKSIIVQTNYRKKYLNKPIRMTQVRNNQTEIDPELYLPSNYHPYQKYQANLFKSGNTLNGNPESFVEEFYRFNVGPFLFALDVDVKF